MGQVIGVLGSNDLAPISYVNTTSCGSLCTTLSDTWVLQNSSEYVFVTISAEWGSPSSNAWGVSVPSFCSQKVLQPIPASYPSGEVGFIAIYACTPPTANGGVTISMPSSAAQPQATISAFVIK